MNSYSTIEVIDVLADKAKAKSRLPLGRMFLLGIMAGAFIALGYLSFIRVSGTVPAEWGSFATFLGGCLFPIGLVALTFLGGELVTGNMMVMTVGCMRRKINAVDLTKNWLIALAANYIGGLLVAYFFGHVVGLTEGDFALKTIAAATGKMADSPLVMIVSGVGCNIFVCMAVFIGTMSKDFFGKIFGMWFPVMVFVVCGFQHVVANAFIIPAAMFAGAEFSLIKVLENVFFVFIGNALGGALFFAVPVLLANPSPLPKKVKEDKTLEQPEQVM